MTKDYYKILEISEFSSQEDIKKAYRRLARKWHPDIAGNSADVIFMFKEINEAYEFLSNSVKKADYDKARKFYNYARESKTESTKTKDTNNTYSTKPNFKETSSQDKKSDKKAFSFNWEEFLANKNRGKQFRSREKNYH